ncbi:riboflavin synthase [Actinomycetes bacterium NPDC127524]|uniref:riboflavin synthase n=1 Tax=Bacillus sp. OV322 TaxID=1882764 RepID=UPI0008E9B160|nr:riboflavin synthase [Bacillus sp. OV322]SFC86760.1 riboflavin synthase alpha chain [Bacillus sp. OV322]
MFTGIVEDIGTVGGIKKGRNSMELTILSNKITHDMHLGDSISVNGVCLTVTEYKSNSFTLDVMPETVNATSLINLKAGSPVNLERAMAANGRFGGHFVSGHVDGTGMIVKKQHKENAVYYVIEVPEYVYKYCIPKGSVAIDGVSLTVFDLSENKLTISLIPHTHKETVLGRKAPGEIVNIEADMIGKYMYHQNNREKQTKTSVTYELLEKSGF